MPKNEDFIREWNEVGVEAANGGLLNLSNLLAIYDNLDLAHINQDFLPGEKTVLGKVSERKQAIFEVAKNLWGLSPEDWLGLENAWLHDARIVSGSIETKGKDNLDDVISAEILVRFISTAKIVGDNRDQDVLVDEAINALNLVVGEACAKGRTRMIFCDGISIYAHLRRAGVMVGTGGGKFLPFPVKSLPELLLMLDKEKINQEAYLAF